jgi:hypothetical protein
LSDNEARKRAARDFQAANPGTSYTRALRHVTGNKRRPLTAVLGTRLDGDTVSVNLEWAHAGGSGPHCLVVGSAPEAVASLMAVLAAGLTAGQDRGDLQLVLCAGEGTQLGVEHLRVDPTDLADHVDELLAARLQLLQSLEARDVEDARDEGHRVATTVVLIEDLDGRWARSDSLGRWVRMGRSAGINIVLGAAAELPGAASTSVDDMSPAQVLDRLLRTAHAGGAVAANMSSATLFSLGGGRGTLRTLGQWDPDRRRQAPDVLVDFTISQ